MHAPEAQITESQAFEIVENAAMRLDRLIDESRRALQTTVQAKAKSQEWRHWQDHHQVKLF